MVEQLLAPEDFSTAAEEKGSENTAKPLFNEVTSKDIKDVFNQLAQGVSSVLEQYLPKLSLEDKAGTLKETIAPAEPKNGTRKETNCQADPKGVKEMLNAPKEFKDPKELIDKLAKIEKPLTKMEHKILATMRASMRSGDLEGTQQMLQTLAADPMSAQRVLRQIQRGLEKENPLRTVGWSMDKDKIGNVSIHMKVSERIHAGKNSPENVVTLDSNGPAHAVYIKNGEQYKRSPSETLAQMLTPRKK